MFSTIEVIVEQNGTVHLLEPLRATRPTRALLTLLEPLDKPLAALLSRRPLHDFIGVLKNASAFNGDPVALQRAMRDEWD